LVAIGAWAVALTVLAATAGPASPGRSPASPGPSPAGAAPDPGPSITQSEADLIAVLKSDRPSAEKAITCKRLAVCGTGSAAPALAPLLEDEQLASWARIALEAIPDPACDQVLRQAVGKVRGRLLVGVINSLGMRRDAGATDVLIARLKDADADVASAAAAALGRIGGPRAAQALEPALATAGPGAPGSAVAEGCILCAERFLAEGKAQDAVRLYDAVRQAAVPAERRLEATRGAILARGPAGKTLLVEELRAADQDRFFIALRTARELAGPEVTEALVAEMARLGPDRQALLVLALADRGDAKALPAVLAAAERGPAAARIMAIGAMERFGDASCVPVLLEAAVGADAEIAQAARTALVRLPGSDVDADLAARLPRAKGKARLLLIELAGQRRIGAALPALADCAADAEAPVRSAAVAAIGFVGGGREVPRLVTILQKTGSPEEQAEIEKALLATCARGGAACAPSVMPLARSGDGALRAIALRALACAGGPDALATVKAALRDQDETVQDEAVRTLSAWHYRWPEDAGAAGPLLDLAKSGTKPLHRALALRGYLQYLQGAGHVSDAERLAKVTGVLPLVARPEEKRLAASVLGTIADARALEVLVTFAEDPAVAEEACAAIIGLVGRKELQNIPKIERQKALQTVLVHAKSRTTKRKAQEMLGAIP
jgi:HEAT repeat protein